MSYICDGLKYTFENHTIALPVHAAGIPDTHEGLFIKDTFHISLVCIGEISARLGIQIDEVTAQKYFCEHIAQNELLFLQGTEWRRVADGANETLVLMCEIRGLDGFFDILREKIDMRIENQPTHITVFTKIKNEGIWIIDESDMQKTVLEEVTMPIVVNI
jgi:hypothetical protein